MAMTSEQAHGVQVLEELAERALKWLPRDTARAFIDDLTNEQLSSLMKMLSQADVTRGGTGDLLAESAAERLQPSNIVTLQAAS